MLREKGRNGCWMRRQRSLTRRWGAWSVGRGIERRRNRGAFGEGEVDGRQGQRLVLGRTHGGKRSKSGGTTGQAREGENKLAIEKSEGFNGIHFAWEEAICEGCRPDSPVEVE